MSSQIQSEKITNLKKKKTSKKKRSHVLANLTETKYSIVKTVCLEAGMRLTDNDGLDCLLIWNDAPVPIDKIVELKFFQRINHFPGMGEICRKDGLARNMSKMQKVCPEEFNFVPQTWVFPGEYSVFHSYLRDLKKKKKHRTFIVKPANGAMGNGIRLTRSAEKLQPHDNIIIQEYIEKPMLMESFKFDLRIYVLVTSCDPLKVFLYNEGLVRMSTVQYVAPSDSNLDCHFMHLTNYSVNKFSDSFVKTPEEDKGSKRTLTFLFDWLKAQGKDVDCLWANMQDVIVKTLITAEAHVYRAYHVCRPSDPAGCESVCFEVLGFDILIDKKMKPWVLEVNRAPSFGTDQPLDFRIKKSMLRDTFQILNIRLNDKKRGMAQEKREAQERLLRPVKRSDDTSGLDKRRLLEERKTQLKVRLIQLRREAAREEHENENMGQFRRIYPAHDVIKSTKYRKLLECAAKVFTGRPYLQKDVAKPFQALQEDEVVELLEQIEDNDAEALVNDACEVSLILKGPKPLSSMPCAKAAAKDDSCSDAALKTRPYSSLSGRKTSALLQDSHLRKSISKSLSSLSLERQSQKDAVMAQGFFSKNEEDLTRQSLQALNNMRIKFPGKSDDEAAALISLILENWKYHKPKVASYWLVKLDSLKRRKVIDIVKGNVHAILQRVWGVPNLDSLRLCRILSKIFNRFVSNHGQGLWTCLNSSTEDSWESIICKTTDGITVTEMNCCRRVVQLCRECLLVVYEFASQAESAASRQSLSSASRTAPFFGRSSSLYGENCSTRKTIDDLKNS